MIAIPPQSTLIGEILVIALIALVLYVIYTVGKSLGKILIGIIINSVLGIAAIFVLNYVFYMGIPLQLYTIIPTVLFGLPAVGTFVIFRFFGVL